MKTGARLESRTPFRYHELLCMTRSCTLLLLTASATAADRSAIITDPAQSLTSGIEIEASPGRKRVKRISLLSGGERSLTAMAFLFVAGVTATYWAEAKGNPLLAGTDQHPSAVQSGGNMEGKEVRFGVANSALFATITTDASCGAVNSMHDSYTPLGGMVPLINIMLGEVVFGGVGAGLYGIFVFVVLAVFIAGLMVGRTPEYLGKKIEAYDVKMAMLAVLILTFTILGFSALAVVKPFGTAGISNPGPHGLSQILYAYVSSTGNNGSAFAGINANTMWYNTSTAVAQLLGRFFMIIPIMAIAGNLATKKTVPESAGTFPVTGALFSTLLVSTILIVGALTFFPALSLGPILEHLLMMSGKVF